MDVKPSGFFDVVTSPTGRFLWNSGENVKIDDVVAPCKKGQAMTDLIITNGDSAADGLRQAGYQGDILPWRDILHDGPVPEGMELEQLSVHRVGFIADAFGQPQDALLDSFRDRDALLRRHGTFETITLWFEHDLYDQLQLLQILDFFQYERRTDGLHLIQADDYLGEQSAESLPRFEAKKKPVSQEQLTLASDLFAAFRKPAPSDLAGFLGHDLAPLPFMGVALRRLFEDLPDRHNGLSRTQRQALFLVQQDRLPPKHLFAAAQKMEEAIFMGDWSFWRCLEELAFNDEPLLQGLPNRFGATDGEAMRKKYLDASLSLTGTGLAVLANRANHADVNRIDRWLGGTAITEEAPWRWDALSGNLLPPAVG